MISFRSDIGPFDRLAFTARDHARWPALSFVSLKRVDNCRQCFLFRQAWYAAHEIVGTPHERGVHGVGGIGELYNRASGY